MRFTLAILFSFLLLTGIAEAGAEQQINERLKAGGMVYLSAGVYEVEGPIIIGSNTILTGDPNAIIKVSSSSSQWFTGSTGIISCTESVKNVEIYGFQINGNLGSLPASFANTPGHDKDAERCIILHGNSGDYAENIRIHDMKLYDSFSDGMYIYYAKNVKVYNNFISNCQHEGIFWSVVIGGEMFNNKVAGITSDCARLDNSIGCRVFDNIFFSYDGTNLNSAYPHGENGIQVGDAGRSHGYDASNKPTTTTNIEITNNTFANNGLKAIMLGSNSDNNVYIHNNQFIGKVELETMGIPVEVMSGNISYTNPPTKEMSEGIFSSLFDILDRKFTTSANVTQNNMYPAQTWEKKGKYTEAWIDVLGYRDQIKIGNQTYIRGNPEDLIISQSGTKNNAPIPTGQETKQRVTRGSNNSMVVSLDVKTEYKTKSTKPKHVLGGFYMASVLDSKSETETFTTTVQIPEQFPVLNEPDVSVTYYNNSYNPHTIISIEDLAGITKIEYTYNGSVGTNYRLVGEEQKDSKGFVTANFSEVNTWDIIGDNLSNQNKKLYLTGVYNNESLTVNVFTPYESFNVTHFNYVEIPDESSKILNPGLWAFIGTFSIFGIFIYRNSRRMIPKW